MPAEIACMPERPVNELLSDARTPARVEVLPQRHVQHLTFWNSEVVKGGQRRRFGTHELPDRVGVVRPGRLRILCLSPVEWLLVQGDGGETQSPSAAAASSDDSRVLTDLSAGLSVLEVSGAAVRHVLNQACSLDFDAKAFPPDHCARTRFAQIPVVIDFIQSPDRFELYVARSLSFYLCNWLEDALGMRPDG
jgi:heterotetrameric sarcosine oxidase gamma subunit